MNSELHSNLQKENYTDRSSNLIDRSLSDIYAHCQEIKIPVVFQVGVGI